jgi:hypothetical protein
VPGIITGLAAAVTAVTGLVVAINQTSWFGPGPRVEMTRGGAPASPVPSGPAAPAPVAPTPPAATSTSPPGATQSIRLPALRDYRLGETTFTVLEATVAPRTSEKDELRVRVRMLNRQRYDANFWDSSFRLLVDGVPVAPIGGLNEVVPGQAAKEGDVLFALPRGTPTATLKIAYASDSTDIPLNLHAPR